MIRTESFPHTSVQVWNGLREEVVRGANVDSFKNRLDRHLSREPIVYGPLLQQDAGATSIGPKRQPPTVM